MKFADIYDTARPYIACFAILRRGNEIAMVKRKNTGWMDGYYGLPAGKVEYGETYTQGAVREVKEEAGVEVRQEDLLYIHTVHRHSEQLDGKFQDWIDVYFEVKQWEGEPYNAEEEKAESLDWLDFNNLPDNIVPPVRDALVRIHEGKKYSEYGW